VVQEIHEVFHRVDFIGGKGFDFPDEVCGFGLHKGIIQNEMVPNRAFSTMTGKKNPPIDRKADLPDKTKPREKSKRFSRGFSFMPDQTVGRDRLILTNGPQGKFTYTRKPGGQVESVTSGYTTDGATATYDYNALNLIRSVTSGTQSYSLTYDAVGNLSYQSLPNGMGVTYGYDDLNRLTFMQVYNSSVTLASYTYTLGASGNRIGVTETGGRAVTWTPDDLYRLTQEDISGASVTGSIGYSMDNVGNRQTRTSNITAIPTQTFSGAYDSNDCCTATGFTWDANGNMLTDLQGRTFTYDPLNRLTSVTGTGVAVSYVYNADNLRVKKINSISGVTTEYHWDKVNVTGNPQVLEELEGGAVVCRYGYGTTGVLSQSRKVNGSWVTSYFGKDAQSVRFLMDESGNITDSWTWDAYGNLLGRTGTTTCNLGYDGEYMEPETGLVYLRARWYDPSTGRFLQMDGHEGEKQNSNSLHKYFGFGADPINNSDPSGYVTVLGRFKGIIDDLLGLGHAWMLYTGTQVIWYSGQVGDQSERIDSFYATSGSLGHQNSSVEEQKFRDYKKDIGGPIPAGNYAINLVPGPDRIANHDRTTGELVRNNNGGGIERIPESVTLDDGSVYEYPGWGTIRARLDPMPGTNTYGREGFYLHDSNKGHTHGCIETSTVLFDKYLLPYRNGHSNVQLRVGYIGASTNGGRN